MSPRATTGTTIGLAPGAPAEAAGQDAAKYGTTNPVVQRLLGRWMDEVHSVLGDVSGVVVDVGVGEGLALERMVPGGHPAVGLEYRLDKARAARQRLDWLAPVSGDAGMLPFPDDCADLVTCIELLEHLPRYRPAVLELARITRGRCVVSVPWEPWFRLGNLGRGKNVRRFGNDPEHVQAFTPKKLVRALRRGFRDVELHPSFPWLIAECRGPKGP
ncbi:MAG TPA: methyltransferase domain-containing protein [Acidimicrobiales bacterium]|nr:methyltransferase domain-containing protein [Acidimicrobiales bacterium]